MENDELKELALQKEKEWKLIEEKRIEKLEATLKEKCKELDKEKEKFYELKEDFKYNLKLLEQRDNELDELEKANHALKMQVSERTAEISELKIRIDELKLQLSKETGKLEEINKQYFNRLSKKDNELHSFLSSKNEELKKERFEIESYKQNLVFQIQTLKYDLEKQRTEMQTEFDEIMRKREQEAQKQIDEKNTELLAKDLQIRLLDQQLEMTKTKNNEFKAQFDEIDGLKRNLELKLKETQWELKDQNSLKNAKIQELEKRLEEFELNEKHKKEDFNRKFFEYDKTVREKDLQIENLINLKHKNEKEIEINKKENEQIRKTINKLEISLKEKEEEINKLNEDLINLRIKPTGGGSGSGINENQLSELISENNKLKTELKLKYKTISDYKKKFEEFVSREQYLENEKIQIDLDWQKKYQSLENSVYTQYEELLNKINDSKDQAYIEIKKLQEKLKHKENLILLMNTSDPGMNFVKNENNEIKLKEENEYLKQIIKQMREEMESLADNIPIKQAKAQETNENKNNKRVEGLIELRQPFETKTTFIKNIDMRGNEGYISDLETQISELKEKNRKLQSQVDGFYSKQKLPDNISDNTMINAHIQSLNQQLNALRKEKVEMTSYLKKQQIKIMHLEKCSNNNTEETRQKQAEIDTLKYELNTQIRRYTTEINSLKQKCADLELQLNESRKEADEYHKVIIEKDSEIFSLESKISELKIQLSTNRPQINFGEQELYIQQLQDEIEQLNKRLINSRTAPLLCDGGETQNEVLYKNEINKLKLKLKTAAKHISELIQEKQQLIEMSNNLRAEIDRLKYKNDEMKIRQINETQHPESKLNKLENMQYNLTKKELHTKRQKSAEPTTRRTNETNLNLSTETTGSTTVNSEHIREIWKILDEKENNSIIFNDKNTNNNNNNNKNNNLVLEGHKKTIIKSDPQTNKQIRLQNIQQQKKPKIRNYNVKDE